MDPTLPYTMLRSSNGGATPSSKIDGISQWEALSTGQEVGPRTSFVYNIDPVRFLCLLMVLLLCLCLCLCVLVC